MRTRRTFGWRTVILAMMLLAMISTAFAAGGDPTELSGTKHIERFSLLKTDGSPNESALNAFSYFAKTALNDFSLTEIDHEDLIGCFIECDVEHDTRPNKNKPDKTVTFARLADKRPSDGWDSGEAPTTAPAPKAAPAPSQAANKAISGKKPTMDLAALLG